MEQPEMDMEQEEYTEQESQEQEDQRLQRIHTFAHGLLKKRAEAIEYRSASGIERRWRVDEQIFDGMDGSGPNTMLDYATGEAQRQQDGQEAKRSKVVVNIIRGRCETAEGRFTDIQLPVDDKNWGLKTTPVPELSDQLKDERKAVQNGEVIKDAQGKEQKIKDIARHEKELAEKAMRLMEAEIHDQLTECDYNGESRKMIRQAVRLGTGVLKGPLVVKDVKQRWLPRSGETGLTVHELQSTTDTTPASTYVDCWNVYPSPGTKENVQKSCEFIWEREEILPREVRALIGMEDEGYFDDQLKLVLAEMPLRTRAAPDGKGNTSAKIDTIRQGMSFEKWEYHGDVDRDDLEALGCDCDDLDGKAISACVVFINDRPVKAELNTLDTGHLPYDFFQWTVLSSDDPWGIGIPRMMLWLQRIITAAWRRMMDNAGDSAGPTVIMKQGVNPANGLMEVGGKRIFIDTTDGEDVRHAFFQYQLDSNQPELQAIIELALRFVDLETSMPTIFQGEGQEIPDTLGATNIVVDYNNIGVRSRVKLYDDRVTRPHINRYYHHNMQYSDNPDIKGDFKADPRGVSVLLEKDKQAQTLQEVFAMKADPDINRITDWEKAGKQYFASRKLDILKSEEEIEQTRQAEQQGPPPTDPRIEAATIRAESVLQHDKLQQDSDMAELQFKAEEAEKDRGHDKIMKEMDVQLKMMEFAKDKDISLDKLKVQLTLGGASLQQKQVDVDKKASAARESAVPEVLKPEVEPPGRAPAGEAFQL